MAQSKFDFLQKITAFLNKLSKREKLVLYGAAAFLSVAFFDRAIFSPIYTRLGSVDKDIAGKEAAIKRNMKILAQKDRIELEAAEYKSFMAAEGSEDEEIAVLMKELETIAAKSSVYVIDMKPGTTQKEAAAKRFQVTLNCEAQLAQLTDFMYGIETSKKILSVDRFALTLKSKDGSTVKCSMTVSKIILYKSE